MRGVRKRRPKTSCGCRICRSRPSDCKKTSRTKREAVLVAQAHRHEGSKVLPTLTSAFLLFPHGTVVHKPHVAPSGASCKGMHQSCAVVASGGRGPQACACNAARPPVRTRSVPVCMSVSGLRTDACPCPATCEIGNSCTYTACRRTKAPRLPLVDASHSVAVTLLGSGQFGAPLEQRMAVSTAYGTSSGEAQAGRRVHEQSHSSDRVCMRDVVVMHGTVIML